MRKRAIHFLTRATIPAIACLLALWMPGMGHAGDHARLAGHWNFNASQSDDAREKVHEAQQNSKINADRNGTGYPGQGGQYPGGGQPGGGYPGGGYPGGGYPGGGYPVGGIGRGGMGGIWAPGGGVGRSGHQSSANRAGVSSEEWDRLAQDPKSLSIDQRSKQIVVTDDNENVETFYPDGKKHDEKDSGGNKVTTKTEWEGGVLTAESKLRHSERLTETFRVSTDGKQLFVTTLFEEPTLSGPLSIRRVYDLAKAPAK